MNLNNGNDRRIELRKITDSGKLPVYMIMERMPEEYELFDELEEINNMDSSDGRVEEVE